MTDQTFDDGKRGLEFLTANLMKKGFRTSRQFVVEKALGVKGTLGKKGSFFFLNSGLEDFVERASPQTLVSEVVFLPIRP